VRLFWHIVVGENEETIVREIEKAIQRANIQCDYRINFREAPSEGSKGFMPYTVEESNPYVRAFVDSVVNVCGEEPAIAYFQSIGDFNYLGTRLEAPVVLFGAEGENFHSHNEYATISSIVKTAEVIYDFLTRQLV
jgi:succinyl-diaminopimelate desuccinylase